MSIDDPAKADRTMDEKQALALIASTLTKIAVELHDTNRALREIAGKLPAKPPGNLN